MKERKYDIAFIFLMPLVVMFSLPWHRGFLLGDDYLGAAHQLIHGHWDIDQNFWANRVGSYIPYAIGMYLFGFGPWLNAITTFEFLLLLYFVYRLLGRYDKSIAFMTACIMGISTVFLQNSGVVMGDILATLTTNAVIFSYFYYSFFEDKNKRSSRNWGIITAVLLLVAFWVKESVAFYTPLLLWLYWQDHKDPGRKPFWKYLTMISVFSLLSILLIYWLRTGDPLFRLHTVESRPSASDSNYSHSGWQTIINRITWQPFQFLMETYSFGSIFILSFLQTIVTNRNSDKIEKFFKIYTIAVLGMWWLGSQGLSSYNPVALLPRLWLPVLVPMTVNSVFFIRHIMRGDLSVKAAKMVSIATLGLFCISLISLYSSYISYKALSFINPPALLSIGIWYCFLSASILLSIHTDIILPIIPSIRSIFFCILIFPFVSGGAQEVSFWLANKHKGIKNGFELEKEMVLYTISLKPRIIITDYRVTHFYYAYISDMDRTLPFVDYNSIPLDSVKKGDYLLLNPERQLWFENNINVTLTYTRANYQIAPYVSHPELNGFVLIKENETDRLYRFEGNWSY